MALDDEVPIQIGVAFIRTSKPGHAEGIQDVGDD